MRRKGVIIMINPCPFINRGELIFNHIFCPDDKWGEMLSLDRANYKKFFNKIFIRALENRSDRRLEFALLFSFNGMMISNKNYSLKQRLSTKCSLTATGAAGIFQSQRV